MANGRGAWTTLGKPNQTRQYQYISGLPLDGSSRTVSEYHYCVWLGVKAIQNQLNTLPSTPGLLTEDGLLGQRTSEAIKSAQAAMGLKVDGIAGAIFCTALWRPLIKRYSTESLIDPKYLYGMMYHESNGDPGAQGWANPYDHGLIQINNQAHPEITIEQAHDPRFSLSYAAKRFKEAMNKYSGKGIDLQIKCAILQHNSPLNASKLYATGFYPSTTAQAYVEKVLEHSGSW